MPHDENLSIIDVLENLSAVAEADALDALEVTPMGHLILRRGEGGPRDITWITAGANEETLKAIRENFRVVHQYLESFYQRMSERGDEKRLVEGVSTIMVLVGEAARKLEHFDRVFQEKIPTLPEYKNLQSFYRTKMANMSAVEHVPGLEDEAFEEAVEESGAHLLNDLETVKKDTHYELFYMLNEAHHPFYTQDLARNIKLACEFGEYAKIPDANDPLLSIKNWEDKSLYILAQKILERSKSPLQKFYKGAMRYKEVEIVAKLNEAIFALMLASNPKNQIRQFASKGAHLYFADFQRFLREVLENREYQRSLLYAEASEMPFFLDALRLVHALIYNYYTIAPYQEELEDALKSMVGHERKIKSLSTSLKHASVKLHEALSKHPSGPVMKALDLIVEEGEERTFDPWMLGNLPGHEATLKWGEHETAILRLPCPTTQPEIDHAIVIEEFKAFLQALVSERNKQSLLFINFQDRTGWREHARCKAIEELSKQAEFASCLTVVTFASDTEFCKQSGPYTDLTEASEFMTLFLEQLQDEATGYAFPAKVAQTLFPSFAKKLLKTIHEACFDEKDALTQQERVDFIEIATQFLILKCLETATPDFVTFSSKDSLDLEGEVTVGLIALLSISPKKEWGHEELDSLLTLLFGATLMQRERLILEECFQRLYSMIERLEHHPKFLSHFADLYEKETLNIKISFN